MCIYGIELLPDNAAECRANLLDVFAKYLALARDDDMFIAAERVLSTNIVNGDALTMTTWAGSPVTFPEWGYLGKGRFQRRDFRYDALVQMSSFGEGTLFADLGKHEVFTPVKQYPPLTVAEVARG
jgi:hypothetical protein